MASKRDQIMDALETRLGTISPANGCSFTIPADSVAQWRKQAFGVSDLPFIDIRDPLDTMPEVSTAGRRNHELQVEIDLFFAGDTSVANARNLVADVATIIGTDDTFSGLAYKTEIVSAAIEMDQENKVYSAAQVSIVIYYRTNQWSL